MALRFADMTSAAQDRLIQRFRNWAFLPPPAPPAAGHATGGRGQGQRLIASNTHTVPTNWVGIPPPNGVMATGAEGVVHLWCDVDPHTQMIHDRVVVKTVVLGSARYLDQNNWVNRAVGGEPLECHQANVVWLATTQADRQHIQECLGWGAVVSPTNVHQTYKYRLYHEYCAHKNLDKVMKILPRRRKAGAARRGKKRFPEPFLWYMFESLAKACVGMEAAYTHANGISDGVVHQDLHPGNVFFDTPNPNRFAMYPVLKVADFGSARQITLPVRRRLAIVQSDPVCVAYSTPENAWNQAPWYRNPPTFWACPNIPISKKTNIYQVGLIMASAMRRLNPLPEADWRTPPVLPRTYNIPPANQLHHDGVNAPAVGVHELSRAQLNPGPKKYSNALVDLVEQCLRHSNRQRPTADALLQAIGLNADFDGMDTAVRPLTAAQRKNCIDLDDEGYAVNSIF